MSLPLVSLSWEFVNSVLPFVQMHSAHIACKMGDKIVQNCIAIMRTCEQ